MHDEMEGIATAWIELHQSVRDHRKIIALALELDIDDYAAIGLCVSLWLWAVDNCPSGCLGRSTHAIARGAQWRGDPEQLVNGLRLAGLVDERDGQWHIHDWDDYAGKLIERRNANAQRMREARAAHVQNTFGERARPVQSDSTVPNSTEQNRTKEVAPKRRRRTALPENWMLDADGVAYARELGMSERDIDRESEKFYDYWTGEGALKADWAATWRNWVRRSLEMPRPRLVASR